MNLLVKTGYVALCTGFAIGCAGALVGGELRSREREPNPRKRSGALLWPASRLAHNRDGTKDARQDYLSSQTSSMRQLLIMLLTIIVHPFTCGWQQYATRL